MKLANCKVLFACWPLLETCVKAADELELDHKNIFLVDLPEPLTPDGDSSKYKFINQLVQGARFLPPLEPLVWEKGQSRNQIAYLCSTSGTAGKQVCV